MPPKILQRIASRFWLPTLIICCVVFPLEVYHVYKKQKER